MGHANAGGGTPPLVMRWNGSVWATENVPSPATVSDLWDVSAAPASSAFAVGRAAQLSDETLQPTRTLALHSGSA